MNNNILLLTILLANCTCTTWVNIGVTFISMCDTHMVSIFILCSESTKSVAFNSSNVFVYIG